MAIRAVLVSVVAGLSLALPSGKQIEAWAQSAQAWVSERLAQWDAQMPTDESAFVYVSEPVPPIRVVSNPAPASVSAPGSAPTVTEEASKTDQNRTVTTADPKAAESASAAAVAVSEASAPVIPTAPMDLDGTEKRPEVASAPVPVPATVTIGSDAFTIALDATLADFAADITPAATLQPVVAVVAPKEIEPFVPADEPTIDVGYDTERSTDGICLWSEAVRARKPTIKPEPVAVATAEVAPEEVGDEFDPVAMFGLGGETDPSEVATVAEAAPCNPPAQLSIARGEQLTRAVRLTREAVFAWASLLHGPAVVTSTH
jgi:hypothetical protein